MGDLPPRIQLRRTRGWRLPPGAVSVARPGPLGNPFTIANAIEMRMTTPATARAFIVRCHREWLQAPEGQCDWWQGAESAERHKATLARLPQLRGCALACWCPPGLACHADTLIELANAPAPA